MSDFPTLEKIVAVHRWAGRREQFWDARCTGCHWRGDIRGTGKTCIALHAEHVQAEWVKSRTIETVEQLDALPVRSVVRDADGDIHEMDDCGFWRAPRYPSILNAVVLPAHLLYLPEVDA